MANFTDVTITGLCTAFQFQGSQVAEGLANSMPNPEAPIAIVGAPQNNVALPGYGNPGISAWAISAASSAQTIGGIVTGEVRDGQRIVLVNVGANSISTVANGSGSAVGNRFAALVEMAAGTATEFINYAGLWYPMIQASS
jgi:hypothetical protein